MTECVCVFTILLSLNSVLSVLRVVLAPTSILTHINQEVIKVPHPSAMNINDMLMQTADLKRHSYYHPPPPLASCTNCY